MKTPEEFWANVDKSGDCWEWQRSVTGKGYGQVKWNDKKVSAHRLAAFLSGLVDSPIASKDRKSGGLVLHECDNRKCCRPDHLFVGTQSQNMQDMHSKNRHPARHGETNGHAKLSNEQAELIRKMYATGDWTQQKLADLMGVCQTTVSYVIRK